MKHDILSPELLALLKARVLIEANWGKGPSIGPQVCAMEALWKASASALSHMECADRLHKALPALWLAVVAYNDHPSTTKADILALYDRAIDLALKDESHSV